MRKSRVTLVLLGTVVVGVVALVAVGGGGPSSTRTTTGDSTSGSGDGPSVGAPGESDDAMSGLTASSSTDEVIAAINPCPPDVEYARASFSDTYPNADEWAYIESRGEQIAIEGEPAQFTTSFMTESGSIVELRQPEAIWTVVDWALQDPDIRVVLGVSEETNRLSSVTFEFADGRVFLPGTCREPLNRGLNRGEPGRGQELLAEARRLPTPEAQAFLRTGGQVATGPEVDPPVILNPSTVSEELLRSLQSVVLVATIDAVPKAPSTICPKSPAGWGDCFFADAESLARGADVEAYVDDTGVLEIWLTNEFADLTKPVRLLGTVTVPVGLRETEFGVAVSIDINIADSTVVNRSMIDLSDLDVSNPVWGPLHQGWLDSGGKLELTTDAQRDAG